MKTTLTQEQRFEQIDHQFGVTDRKFERMEFRTNQRFEHVEDRLDRHDREFLELRNSITDLAIMTKNEFDRVYERFNAVDARFDGFEKRFDRLEALVKQGFGMA